MRFVSIIFSVFSSLLYYEYTNTQKFLTMFVASLTPEARSLGSIDRQDLSKKRTRSQINEWKKGC